jgi:hypothetical protein
MASQKVGKGKMGADLKLSRPCVAKSVSAKVGKKR